MSKLFVEHLAKSFGTAEAPLQVLTDVSLELSGGQSLAIVGPSGSGKSTLLQILGTLDEPSGGTVRIDDTDPFAFSPTELAAFRNESIGFIFQDHHLLPQLSLIENVLLPTLAGGRPSESDYDRAEELIESVGLSDRRDHLPSELSGGERERVAIARALLMKPTLILADEPTGNLDRKSAESISKLLLDLQTANDAILICVTHSEALASEMQSRKELLDGRLV